MSIESRLARGDNPDDVRKLFPYEIEKIDKIVQSMKKAPKKKAARKK
jgi:hypothetical protein